MAADRAHALAELVARGLVPPGLTFFERAPRHAELEEGAAGRVGSFTDPMVTRHPTFDYPGSGCAGFGAPGKYHDHVSSLIEVATVEGVECRFVRAILTQPYVAALRGAHFQHGDVRMVEVPDLSWHNAGTTLCVFTPQSPLPVHEWRRTFRAWLVQNVHFVDGRVALAGAALASQVFDVLQDATAWVVELGARDVADRDALRARLGEWIGDADFARLWGAYAAWRHAPLWRALCVPLRFLARLRARVAVHRAFAPGGAGYLVAKAEWERYQTA
jgi:hypothetical protein